MIHRTRFALPFKLFWQENIRKKLEKFNGCGPNFRVPSHEILVKPTCKKPGMTPSTEILDRYQTVRHHRWNRSRLDKISTRARQDFRQSLQLAQTVSKLCHRTIETIRN